MYNNICQYFCCNPAVLMVEANNTQYSVLLENKKVTNTFCADVTGVPRHQWHLVVWDAPLQEPSVDYLLHLALITADAISRGLEICFPVFSS